MTSPVSESTPDNQTALENQDPFHNVFHLAKLEIPTSFPYSSITKLNLGNTGLSELPDGFEHAFPNLSILFLSGCRFNEMPAVIGRCKNLQMVAFRANNMTSIHPDALQAQLRWLILTHNQISALPDTIGNCTRMQKLMLSGNQLTELPDTIRKLQSLELIRLSSNQLQEPPMTLLQLPRLSWIAFSGNTFLTNHVHTVKVNYDPLPLLTDLYDSGNSSGEILGQGASGITRKVWYAKLDRFVAVKEYNVGTVMTSDGLPEEERQINCAASSAHLPGLIHVYGTTTANNSSNNNDDVLTSQGDSSDNDAVASLVMEYLHDFVALADPPSMESCSRDVYRNDTRLTVAQAESIVGKMLQALQALHSAGICHGDFYSHNILVEKSDLSNVRLSDFGAAFFYDRDMEYGKYVEMIELRAFLVFVREVININVAEEKSEFLTTFLQKCESECVSFGQALIVWQQAQLVKLGKSFGATED